MRLKSFKIGKAKDNTDGDTAPSVEPVNNKTEDVEVTEQQLSELTDAATGSEEDEDTPPQPHGPLDELTIGPEDQLLEADDEVEVSTMFGKPEEEVKVVEVEATEVSATEAQKEPVEDEDSNSLKGLFSDDEEEENPLANLINSMPDVNAQELVNELEEIKEIIKEWQHNPA